MFRLDGKLLKALEDAALAGTALSPPRSLKVETFLAAIDRLSRDEIRSYFADEVKFRSMCENCWPAADDLDILSHGHDEPSEPEIPGTARGFNIQLDPMLERLLLNDMILSIRSDQALSIPTFIAGLSQDKEVLAHLKSTWDVTLKPEL